MGAQRSAIAVLSSPRGIDWGGTRVNLVLMLAFNKNDADAFHEVFDPLIGMLSDSDKIGRLMGVYGLLYRADLRADGVESRG